MNNVGNRNLIILGAASIALAIVTTSISLVVYHNSGDIYLDRSRPGYLPEKPETEEGKTEDYIFPDTGNITKAALEEYLENLNQVTKELESIKDPFSATHLSDSSLGIPSD